MSSIVTSVLRLTVGLLWNKIRHHAANKLKAGDLTDEMFRQLLVRELDDIKSKLDALIEKDLLSSIEFLRDGICHLEMSLDANDGPRDLSYYRRDSKSSLTESVVGEASSLPLVSLTLTKGRLKIASEERFKRAKEYFKLAGEEATRAFSNQGLGTEERILATKLRITCRILEGLEDPDATAKVIVMYLERLHELPAIQEAFSVYLDGGMKSLFNKSKRLEIVQSVTMINMVLFDFTKKFTRIPQDLFNWPTIELGERTYQPVLRDESISLREFGVETPGQFQLMYGERVEIWNVGCSAVNSKGEIIAETRKGVVSVIDSTTNETKPFCSFLTEDTGVHESRIDSLAVDKDDAVYVVTCCKEADGNFKYKLIVFGTGGGVKHRCPLEFLSSRQIVGIIARIAVNKEKRIVIKKVEDEHLYVCDRRGQLTSRFRPERMCGHVYLSYSGTNEIIAAYVYGNTVSVYTEEGKFKRKIKLPHDHGIYGLAFNHNTNNIIVLTKTATCMHLLNISETDEPQSLSLGFNIWSCNLSSHPNGPVALIHKNGIIFI